MHILLPQPRKLLTEMQNFYRVPPLEKPFGIHSACPVVANNSRNEFRAPNHFPNSAADTYTVNVVPSPMRVSTRNAPFASLIKRCTIFNPKPVPCRALLVVKYGWKIFG